MSKQTRAPWVVLAIVAMAGLVSLAASPAAAQCEPFCKLPTKDPIELPLPWHLISLVAFAVVGAFVARRQQVRGWD